MVHASVGFSRMRNRLQAHGLHGLDRAGLDEHVDRGGVGHHEPDPGVAAGQRHLRDPGVAARCCRSWSCRRGYDISVNDAFRPLSRFFDRVWRPEQLPAALLGAMRVLTDPAETGAVTLALPQDVQAEAHDWPQELFARRVWHIPRPVPEPAALARAVAVIRSARRPLLIAGGGVHYSEATEALRRFAEATGIPVADTQAGKGAILWDHPQAVGGVGSTGSPVANALARDADVVIGVGTRYSDFTTASRTAFQNPGVRFVNLNVAGAGRGQARRGDAAGRRPHRAGGADRARARTGYRVEEAYTERHREPVRRVERGGGRRLPPRATSRCRRRPRCWAR